MKKFLLFILILALLLPTAVFSAYADIALSDGNHEKWFDRIDTTDKDYARKFNNWLYANADLDAIARGGTSALVDPTLATKIADGNGKDLYAYEITKIEGSGTFEYIDGDTSNGERASAAVNDEMNANFDDVSKNITAVYNAFDRDRPEVFWLNGMSSIFSTMSVTYSQDGNVTYTQTIYFLLKDNDYNSSTEDYDIRPADYQSPDFIRQEIKRVFVNPDGDSLVDTILAGVDAAAARVTKIRYFNEWLTTHNCYNGSLDLNNLDHDCREATSALTGLAGNNAEAPVCEAYARALKVLCDSAGIPCVLVNGNAGTGYSKEAHMWNYVQMENGSWYAVDVTWNDPTSTGSAVKSGRESEDYLLVGSNTAIGGMKFSASHIVTNRAYEDGLSYTNEPTLSPTAYPVPSVEIPSSLTVGGVSVIQYGMINGSLPSGIEYSATTNTLKISSGVTLSGTSSLLPYAINCTGDINILIDGHVILKGYNGQRAINVTGGSATVINSSDYFYRTSTAGEISSDVPDLTQSYLEFASERHLTFDGKDDGTHDAFCTQNACPHYYSANLNCAGGEATCHSYAVCSDCGQNYGELEEHTFTEQIESDACLKSDTGCQNKNEYWYACAVCRAASNTLYYTGNTYGSHKFTEQIKDDAHYVDGSGSCQATKKYYLDCELCDEISSDMTFDGGEYLDHTYSAICDDDCNVCGKKRDAAPHHDGNGNYVCDNCSALMLNDAANDIFGVDLWVVCAVAGGTLLLLIIIKILLSRRKEKRKAEKHRKKMEKKKKKE